MTAYGALSTPPSPLHKASSLKNRRIVGSRLLRNCVLRPLRWRAPSEFSALVGWRKRTLTPDTKNPAAWPDFALQPRLAPLCGRISNHVPRARPGSGYPVRSSPPVQRPPIFGLTLSMVAHPCRPEPPVGLEWPRSACLPAKRLIHDRHSAHGWIADGIDAHLQPSSHAAQVAIDFDRHVVPAPGGLHAQVFADFTRRQRYFPGTEGRFIAVGRGGQGFARHRDCAGVRPIGPAVGDVRTCRIGYSPGAAPMK